MDHVPKGPIDLTGQVAMVTGGGRGIGRAIVLGLARAGASVAVVARTAGQVEETVALVERARGRAWAFRADVSDPRAVKVLTRQVERALGAVDLLVNNAGLAGPLGPAWEADAEIWWECVTVNLRGPA